MITLVGLPNQVSHLANLGQANWQTRKDGGYPIGWTTLANLANLSLGGAYLNLK